MRRAFASAALALGLLGGGLTLGTATAVTDAAVNAEPAAAVGWTPQNHPAAVGSGLTGAWGYFYVDRSFNPDFCVALGGLGDSPQWQAYEYARFEDDAGRNLGEWRDYTASSSGNMCANVPAGATRVRLGLYAGGGPSGVHHGYSYVWLDNPSKAIPWYCLGCWGAKTRYSYDPGLSGIEAKLVAVGAGNMMVQSPTPPGLPQSPASSPTGSITAGRCTVRFGFMPLNEGAWGQMWSAFTGDCQLIVVQAVGYLCTVQGRAEILHWPLNFTTAFALLPQTYYVYVLASDGLITKDVVLTAYGKLL